GKCDQLEDMDLHHGRIAQSVLAHFYELCRDTWRMDHVRQPYGETGKRLAKCHILCTIEYITSTYRAMPVVKLTRSLVQTMRCAAVRRKIDFLDMAARGFLLEVRATGGKTFYARYRDERGREHQFKIGPADRIALSQARRRARSVIAAAILGDNPQEKRK